MEFPPGFYFYLSFAFSFFLPSVIHLFTHPSSSSFLLLLLLIIIIIIVVAVIVVFILT